MLTHTIRDIERCCADYTFSLGIVCMQARKDIVFCPFLVFRSGSEKLVPVFLSSLTFQAEVLTNKLERYPGTRPFRDLYMVIPGGGGVPGLRTYGDVPLENLKSYPVPESNSRK